MKYIVCSIPGCEITHYAKGFCRPHYKRNRKLFLHLYKRHPRYKLTVEQVEEIRKNYSDRKISCRIIGEKYGVNSQIINSILLGKSWKPHLIENQKNTQPYREPKNLCQQLCLYHV
jgi:hypothetical protein